MVYADFERLQGIRPVSAQGGRATISSFQQNPAAPTALRDASDGDPALLLDAEGTFSQRAFFDYETRAPNQWAGASLDIKALPEQGSRQRPMDVSGYDTLTVQLSATGTKKLQIELRSRDNGLQIDYGSYPQVEIAVSETPRTYRIALSSFVTPTWVKSPLNTKEVLKRLTEISVKVLTATPAKGRVTVDNLVFERAATAQKPAAQPPVAAQTTASNAATTANPASLEFGVLRQVLGNRPGELAIYYALKNTGSRAITLTAQGLRIRQAGRDLTAGLRVDVSSISLRPGQAHLGTIIVRDAKPGDLELRWLALEAGSGRNYVLERSLRVQVMPGTNRP
jgi:archaellum component FlaG (FlaF/FlaG flagellin family)